MKLSDIVIQEETPTGDKPIELKEVTKYFPNTYQKAVRTLAKQGRLTFGGVLLFTKNGENGPAINKALAEAHTLITDKDGDHNKVQIRVEMNGSVANLDNGTDFDIDAKIDDVNQAYIGYAQKGDYLIIGYDAWISDNEFNEEWDKKFEETFGEDFDNENTQHEKILNAAWKQFRDTQMFFGIAVEVDTNFYATMEEMPGTGGFYKGLYPRLKDRRIIDFD